MYLKKYIRGIIGKEYEAEARLMLPCTRTESSNADNRAAGPRGPVFVLPERAACESKNAPVWKNKQSVVPLSRERKEYV